MSVRPFSAADCANALLFIATHRQTLPGQPRDPELLRCLAALLCANHRAYKECYGKSDGDRLVNVEACAIDIRAELQHKRAAGKPHVFVDDAREFWRLIGSNMDAGTDQLALLANGPDADRLIRLVWPFARRDDEYLCGCGCVFFEASLALGARKAKKGGVGVCWECVKEIARQRTLVPLRAAPPWGGSGPWTYAIIGRLWHTLRTSTLGIRFAPTAELAEQMVEGLRWEPVVAVMPAARAQEIIRRAQERASCGPWVEQIDKVLTEGERAAVNAVWDDMPGNTCFVHALQRIAGGRW
jgi:hypothetical protein